MVMDFFAQTIYNRKFSLNLLREKTLLSLLHHAHCTELVYPVFHSVGSIYFL